MHGLCTAVFGDEVGRGLDLLGGRATHKHQPSAGLPTPGAPADLLLQHVGATGTDARRWPVTVVDGA